MISAELEKHITKDAYTEQWKRKVSICLLTVGMSEKGIISILEGTLKGHALKEYCKRRFLPYKCILSIIK